MEKPLTLQAKEFEEELVKMINSFKLPAYVLKNELTKVYNQIENLDLEEVNKYLNNKESE